MKKFLFIASQYLLPQLLLTKCMAPLANLSTPRWRFVKNFLIRCFIKHYHVKIDEAEESSPDSYISFNHFFVRRLKSGIRPLASTTIISPVDGTISQLGSVKHGQLIQAKGKNYSLKNLLAGDNILTEKFHDALFATLYLAPYDYHRVHMPISGKLLQTIYVPGKLFSVNTATAESVNNLFAQNERLICEFETAIGPMALIFVGAMLVAGVHTTWGNHVTRSKKITVTNYHEKNIILERGEEAGYFKFGSTVILLFSSKSIRWENLLPQQTIIMGQGLATNASA